MRDAGLAVVLGAGGSFKSQMKKADASGARFAVILGDAEVQSGQVSLKPLRSEVRNNCCLLPRRSTR
jgi:histidyl-tRNA synthetase